MRRRQGSPISRRGFLRASGLVAISAIVPGCDRNQITIRAAPTGPDMEVSADTPLTQMPAPPITANGDFFVQSIQGRNYDPRLKPQAWSLRVGGLVTGPESVFTYRDLTSLPPQRQVTTMQCIGNWVGGPLVGNAEWAGTRLANLLDQVGVGEGALRVKFTSADGYSTSIPLEDARRDDVLLAWEMNGEALPARHGYPLRLVNPGHYGQKMPKWITGIELVDEVYLGFWERRPRGQSVKWSDDALVTVNSRIDAPLSPWDDTRDPAYGGARVTPQTLRGRVGERYVVHGIALAGAGTVERVEVSTDGGVTWREGHLMTRPEPNVWVTWAVAWSLPVRGRYELVVRAFDTSGRGQPPVDVGADIYDGRTAWHRVPVKVATT